MFGESTTARTPPEADAMDDSDEREEEFSSLGAIYPELQLHPKDRFTAYLDLAVAPSKPLMIRFVPDETASPSKEHTYSEIVSKPNAYIEHDVGLSHLPSLRLRIELPDRYPEEAPPTVQVETTLKWLSADKLKELESEAEKLWEEYGRCQILFAYIDHLQQAADRGFDLDQSVEGCLVLSGDLEKPLRDFDECARREIFNAGTYDCTVCLEPKKGTSCYKVQPCGHVFCKQCLCDFFNQAIAEGDVAGVKCLSPDCGKDDHRNRASNKRKKQRTLHPRELFDIGLEEATIRRYVELKRNKKMGADKSTVYCPRTWCQGAARSVKYRPIPTDLTTYLMDESDTEEQESTNGGAATEQKTIIPANPADRLAICEKCKLAFCKVCYLGWHGTFARCYPRDPNELSEDEKASYAYIRHKTSPCPTCACPVQKTMGCNHMTCVVCRTHFCYLCGAWLSGDNPYPHFNKPGTECYQRIWEADGGEEQAQGNAAAAAPNWEQMAIEAARAAEEREAVEQAQMEENDVPVARPREPSIHRPARVDALPIRQR